MTWTYLFAQLGITVAAAAAAAFALFQWFGKKWLDARFKQDLEAFKAKKNLELENLRSIQALHLEQLRLRIQTILDRISKLHQHEFEVLPAIWDKMSLAISEGVRTTNRFQSYPETKRMGDGEFEEFLASSDLKEWEKGELRSLGPERRDESLHEKIFWYRLHQAEKSHAEFHNYLIAQGIFIEPKLKEMIRSLSNMNYDAIHERRLDKDVGRISGQERFPNGDLLQREGLARMNAIQEHIQKRLWDTNTFEGPRA